MDNKSVEALRSLRDIKGIQGSFVVCAGSGEVLGRDLPAIIDDAVLSNVGPRIDRLLNIIDSTPATETVAMRFGDHRLDVKRLGNAHLCVVAEAAVSPPALRMAMKLVARKLVGYDWAAELSTRKAPVVAAPTVAEPAKRTVQFRGRTTTI
jgi:hypothetical protein